MSDLPLITVVGLGPGGPDLITEASASAIRNARHLRLRTRVHPAASVAPDAETFDAVYEQAESIEGVYEQITEQLVALATEHGELVYAVPGSPLVAESTVDRLRSEPGVRVEVMPALSFLDLVWNRLGVDPFLTGPRLIDGRQFAVEAAGERGPLLVAQCDAPWVLSDIKLAFEDRPPGKVIVLQRLGLPDERITEVDWEDLDRVIDPDHLTSLWIPLVDAPVAFELVRVDQVSRRLRADCPWDKEQTHASLRRYLLEETYELIDAIEGLRSDEEDDEHLIEELGDVLYQVLAHSAIAAEEGRFNIADVAQGVSDKLIKRHPHVYGDVVADSVEDVVASWEASKLTEKGRSSVMEGIPRQLPALLYALKVLKKAAGAGVELDDADLADAGLGGALMATVEEARRSDTDPEEALRRVTDRFRVRFEEIERAAAKPDYA